MPAGPVLIGEARALEEPVDRVLATEGPVATAPMTEAWADAQIRLLTTAELS